MLRKIKSSTPGRENLAKAMSISSAFNLFMTRHRTNILLSNYDSVGIGIVPQKWIGVIVT